ncbi:MAG: PIG-L family deacetylase [Planctomycetes bacterium]|nr:PIG-L family deacetylase [Planctomycetota bacterium]
MRARTLDDDALRRPALVVAPHFDDETLGCGGTILRKRALGVPVHVLFVTDGARSHARWTDAAALAARRSAEGRAAAAALGVGPDDVTCLDLPESRLDACGPEAVPRVVALLERVRPQQVFAPHRREPPDDHARTWSLVASALDRWPHPVQLYEYPIWLWDRWPWTDASPSARWAPRARLRDLRAALGLLRELGCRVDVDRVRAAKRVALEAHASQMARPDGVPEWPVLGDVRDGEWLEHLLGGSEYFMRARRVDARGSP